MNRRDKRRRSRRGLVGIILITALLLLIADVAVVGISLQAASRDLKRAASSLAASDESAAAASTEKAGKHSAFAYWGSRGPVWWAASQLPWFGDDVGAVRTLAGASQTLTHDVLPPLADASGSFGPKALSPVNGKLPVGNLQRIAPDLVHASQRMDDLNRDVQAIEPAGLIPPLSRQVLEAQTKLAQATPWLDKSAAAAGLLPDLLGANGPRNILLVTQNNAEARALGGTAGALALLRADGGRVQIDRQVAASSLGSVNDLPQKLTAEERQIYSTRLERFTVNPTMTPSFPRAAAILSATWRSKFGDRVDAVLSVDPVALSKVIAGTGPIELGDGARLTSESVVPYLLSTVYAQYEDPQAQDLVFAAAARSVFTSVTGGRGDMTATLRGLVEGVREHRVLLWSRRQSQQEVLGRTVMGGDFFADVAGSPSSSRFGVFLEDNGNDKMTYYLRSDVRLKWLNCGDVGGRLARVDITLRNVVPNDGEGLPDYVDGFNPDLGIPHGAMRVTTRLYAPLGAQTETLSVDRHAMTPAVNTHEGHEVSAVSVQLTPGEERSVAFTVRLASGASEAVDVWQTPGIDPPSRVGPYVPTCVSP